MERGDGPEPIGNNLCNDFVETNEERDGAKVIKI